jgi:hypothetical protein
MSLSTTRLLAVQGFLAGFGALACAACSAAPTTATYATTARPARSVSGSVTGTPASSASASPSASDPIDASPPSGSLGYAAVCRGRGSRRAAPDTGPGPHPVDFEGDAGFVGVGGTADVIDNDGILQSTSTDTSDIEPPGWAPARAALVQLVACVRADYTATKVGSCKYYTQRAPLDVARYTISLYVAQTGQRLAGPVTVAGSGKACPGTAIVDAGNPAVYTSLGTHQIEAIVGKYVQ